MKGKIRGVLAAVAVASTALVVTGCGTVGDGGATPDADRELVIGYSAPYLKDQFQVAVADAVVAEAEAQGIRTLQTTDANNDAGRQVTDVRNLIAAGATGIVLIPRDSSAIVPAIDYATSQGVPVVVLDSAPTGGSAYITIRSDSAGMGRQDCEALGEQIGGKGTVLELQGDLASIAGKERSTGFQECMSQNYPDVTIISQPTKWQADVAGNVTSTTLASTPDLAGIYMASDTAMGSAVLAALSQAGRLAPVGQEGHMPLYGIDGGQVAFDAIRAGTMDGTVSQPVDLYAKYGVSAILAAHNGEAVKTGGTDYGAEITQLGDSFEELLPTQLVTKANVDDSAFWSNQGR